MGRARRFYCCGPGELKLHKLHSPAKKIIRKKKTVHIFVKVRSDFFSEPGLYYKSHSGTCNGSFFSWTCGATNKQHLLSSPVEGRGISGQPNHSNI